MSKIQTIPRTLANKLLSLAQLSPDAEICGLISKCNRQKYHVYPVNNIAADASSLFEMEPEQQIKAFKDMREQNETLFAVFHSHPHSGATPSAKDLNDAAYNDTLNIIISLSTLGVLDMRAYFYRNNEVETVTLIIEPG